MAVEVKCSDFLKGNDHLYARKARRKKIAFVRIDATNRGSRPVRILLGSSTLAAGGNSYRAENPDAVLRKLREFTWDFLIYPIIDFHPVTAVLDVAVLLTGPLYNRRLKRQLARLSNEDLVLAPGKSGTALAAFRGVAKPPEKFITSLRDGDDESLVECAVDAG